MSQHPSSDYAVEINPMRPRNERDSEKDEPRDTLKDSFAGEKAEGPVQPKVMIFDTIQLQFEPEVFWFQLGIHLFAFLIPLSPNGYAQGFWGSDQPMAIFYNIGLTLILYLMVASYFLAPSEAFNVMSGAVWLPLIYFIQHKLVVALKYAAMSPSEYKRYMSCHDQQTLAIYQGQLQLIRAWLNREESVLEFELGAAAVRVGAKISDIYFSLPNPKDSLSAQSQLWFWHAFLRGREFVDTSIEATDGLLQREDGSYQLSVYDLCTALVRRCDTGSFGESSCFYVIYVFSFVTLVIPFAILIADYPESAAGNCWVALFYASSSLINVSYGIVVYNLLFVAIFDVLRQLRMVDELATLLRISDLTLPTHSGPVRDLGRFPMEDGASSADGSDSEGGGEEGGSVQDTGSSAGGKSPTFSPSIVSPSVTKSRAPSLAVLPPGSTAHTSLNRQNMASILALTQATRRPSNAVGGVVSRSSRVRSRASSSLSSRGGAPRMHDLTSLYMDFRMPSMTAAHHANEQAQEELNGRESTSSLVFRSSHHSLSHSHSLSHGNSNPGCKDTADTTKPAPLQRGESLSTTQFPAAVDFTRYTEIGERYAEDGSRAEVPRLSIETHDNILAWTYARLVLQNFGDRFRYRIDIYVGGTIAIMVVLIIGALASLLSYSDRAFAMKSCFFLQSLTAINLVYLFLILITYLSACMNDKYKTHKQLMTRHALRFRHKSLEAEEMAVEREELLRQHWTQQFQSQGKKCPRMEEQLRRDPVVMQLREESTSATETVEQLEALSEVLQVEADFKPFTVFGIEATSSLTMTIITSYISFLGVVISMFSSTSLVGQDLEDFNR